MKNNNKVIFLVGLLSLWSEFTCVKATTKENAFEYFCGGGMRRVPASDFWQWCFRIASKDHYRYDTAIANKCLSPQFAELEYEKGYYDVLLAYLGMACYVMGTIKGLDIALKYTCGVLKRLMFYASTHNPLVSADQKTNLQIRLTNLYNAYREYFLTWVLKPDCLRSKTNWEKMRDALIEEDLFDQVYADDNQQNNFISK